MSAYSLGFLLSLSCRAARCAALLCGNVYCWCFNFNKLLKKKTIEERTLQLRTTWPHYTIDSLALKELASLSVRTSQRSKGTSARKERDEQHTNDACVGERASSLLSRCVCVYVNGWVKVSVCVSMCVWVWDRGCAAAVAVTVTKVVAERPSRHFSHVPRLLKKAAAEEPIGKWRACVDGFVSWITYRPLTHTHVQSRINERARERRSERERERERNFRSRCVLIAYIPNKYNNNNILIRCL